MEQDWADRGQVAQERQIELGQGRHAIAHEALADEGAEARAEDRKRQTCCHLVRQQQQDQDPKDKCHSHARRSGRGDAEHGAPGRQRDGEADDGADQHHALDPEIEDSRFLRHQLAGGRQQQRGRGADHRENDRDEPAHAGHDATAPALIRRPRRIR